MLSRRYQSLSSDLTFHGLRPSYRHDGYRGCSLPSPRPVCRTPRPSRWFPYTCPHQHGTSVRTLALWLSLHSPRRPHHRHPRRQWAWLAALTVLASLSWVGLWLITQPWNPADGPILGSFLLLSTAAVAISTAFQETAWHSNPLLARLLTYLTLLLGCAFSALLLARSEFSNTEWLFLGLLSAGCFTLARFRTAYEPFAWFASTFVLVLLAAWGFTGPTDLPRIQIILSTFGMLFSLASYGCLWGSRSPARWTALSVLSALSYTLVAYFEIGHPPRRMVGPSCHLQSLVHILCLRSPSSANGRSCP